MLKLIIPILAVIISIGVVSIIDIPYRNLAKSNVSRESFFTVITGVIDANTFTAKIFDNGKVQSITMTSGCYDSPKQGELADIARDFVVKQLTSGDIKAVNVRKNKEGEIYGTVYVNGELLSLKVISEGLGNVNSRAYTYCVDNLSELIDAQTTARELKKGLWSYVNVKE